VQKNFSEQPQLLPWLLFSLWLFVLSWH
jgi:hypothetical protein